MDVFGALVGVHGLEIDHVAHDVVIPVNSVAAEHVARHAGNHERFAAGIALKHRYCGRVDALTRCLQLAQTDATEQPKGDFCLHLRQFPLDQLIGRKGFLKLLPLHGVFEGTVPASRCRPQCSPRDAETGFC